MYEVKKRGVTEDKQPPRLMLKNGYRNPAVSYNIYETKFELTFKVLEKREKV